jgi:hypothetical protein
LQRVRRPSANGSAVLRAPLNAAVFPYRYLAILQYFPLDGPQGQVYRYLYKKPVTHNDYY